MTVDQQRAIQIVDQLSDNAAEIEDEQIRIRLRAQTANVLWENKEPRARLLFEDAFWSVNKLLVGSNQGNKLSGIRPDSPQFQLFQLRIKVLDLVAKRDPNLAETLLRSAPDITIDGLQGGKNALLLRMAMEIAETNPEQAGRLVVKSLKTGEISPLLGATLLRLRYKNATLADDIFSNLLLRAQQNSSVDMLTVRTLALYVFPILAPDEIQGGGRTEQIAEPGVALIDKFLDFAYRVIARQATVQQVEANSVDPSASSRTAFDYQSGYQLLPFFDRYQPIRSASIRAQLDEIGRAVPIANLQALTSPSNPKDLLTAAEDSRNPRQRDNFYLRAAMLASRQGDMDQALWIAAKISNTGDSVDACSIIRSQAAMSAIGKEDFATAYRYVKDITIPGQCALVIRHIARAQAEKQSVVGALEALSEGGRLLDGMETGAEKAHALLMLAETAISIDTYRGFEVMRSAVKALNEASFRSSDVNDNGGRVLMKKVAIGFSMINFDQSFPVLARADFDRALWLAQSIEQKELSILAQIALCQGVLERTRPSRNARQDRQETKPNKY